jgi:hypothetical protein
MMMQAVKDPISVIIQVPCACADTEMLLLHTTQTWMHLLKPAGQHTALAVPCDAQEQQQQQQHCCILMCAIRRLIGLHQQQ